MSLVSSLLLSVSLLALVNFTVGLSSGAPAEACDTLTPSHGVPSQLPSTNIYTLSLMNFSQAVSGDFLYNPGASYTGRIIARLSLLVVFT